MKIFFLIVLLLFAACLAACDERTNANIEVSGLNYTNTWITNFSVNGYAGHGISPNGGGGAFVCCVTIPREWRHNMMVTVRWAKDDRMPGSWKERVVEVPRYAKKDIGFFAVHFYPDETVKVLVTTRAEGHPMYPYPRPK